MTEHVETTKKTFKLFTKDSTTTDSTHLRDKMKRSLSLTVK